MVLEIWENKNVSELQPITHAWYLEFWATNFSTLSLMMHVSYSILQATHTHRHKDNSKPNQHTLAIHQCFFPLKYESTIGSQGDTTELLHKEQLGSPISQVREQPGSQGSMAVGNLHASAEHPTPNYSATVYQLAMAVRMSATAAAIQSYYIGSN